MATHDQTEALSISDRIVVMNKGRIEQIAPPATLYDRPATKFVASFIGTMNLLQSRFIGHDGERLRFAAGDLPLEAVSDTGAMPAAGDMNLGASPAATFRQVFFPLSLPGLASGVVIVFVLCLGFFVTPALMGGGKVIMWAMRMEQTTSLYSNWGAGSALGVVLLAVTLGLLALFQRMKTAA